MKGRDRPPVQVSAHRCGAGGEVDRENTPEALAEALELGVEYVEFDVQRCIDGTLVCFHDDWLRIGQHRSKIAELTFAEFSSFAAHYLRYEDVLSALAGRARAHIDLKFTSPGHRYAVAGSTYEVAATQRAVEVLGAGNLIVTTLDDKAVRAVRDWADDAGIELLVGLSLGRRVAGLPWHEQVRVRISELLPRLRYLESRANLVVAKHTLARLGVAAFARRRGLPLLVWTIDTPASLRYWLRPGRAWVVTSNHPDLAMEIRDGRRPLRRRTTSS